MKKFYPLTHLRENKTRMQKSNIFKFPAAIFLFCAFFPLPFRPPPFAPRPSTFSLNNLGPLPQLRRNLVRHYEAPKRGTTPQITSPGAQGLPDGSRLNYYYSHCPERVFTTHNRTLYEHKTETRNMTIKVMRNTRQHNQVIKLNTLQNYKFMISLFRVVLLRKEQELGVQLK